MGVRGLEVEAGVPYLISVYFNVQEGGRVSVRGGLELDFPTILGTPGVEFRNEEIERVFRIVPEPENIIQE